MIVYVRVRLRIFLQSSLHDIVGETCHISLTIIFWKSETFPELYQKIMPYINIKSESMEIKLIS